MGILRGAMVAVEGQLPSSDVENVWQLIDAGGLGVAFEILCTQLYEYDVTVDEMTLASLAEVGTCLGLDPRLWDVLSPGV